MNHVCRESNNPRYKGRCDCGKRIHHFMHPAKVVPRNLALERELLEIATRAAGLPDDAGLGALAHARAHAGGIRTRDFTAETMEEYADAANYLRWEIQKWWTAYLHGDHQAADTVRRHLASLSALVGAAHALR